MTNYYGDYDDIDNYNTLYINYFNKLIFDDKYDISLNTIEFLNKYNINLRFINKTKSILSLILSKIRIKKSHIDLFFNKTQDIDNEISLVINSIIDDRNLTLFKYIESKYPLQKFYNYTDSNNIVNYKNIVNYSLFNSYEIFNYIYNKHKINIICYLNIYLINLPTIKLSINGTIENHKPMINDIIQNYKESYNTVLCAFISHIYITNYDIVDYLVYKLNNITLFNKYIDVSIDKLYIENINLFLTKRSLLVPNLNYKQILNSLYSICSNKLNEKYFDYITIINLWKLLFPLVEKKLDDFYINEFFYKNPLNTIVSIKNGKKIIKLIEKYIIDWNISDEYYFIPIMDCIKYGSLDTIKYLLNKYDFEFNHISYSNENIMTCAINNSNIKILEYFISFIKRNNENINQIINFNYIEYSSFLNQINQNLNIQKIYLFSDLLNKNNKYIFLNKIINNNFHNKELVTKIVNKYNIKIELNLSNYNYNYNKCSEIDETYLKFIIDNLNIINYKQTLISIINYGCFEKIYKILDYLLIKFHNFCSYLKENENYNIIDDIYYKIKRNKCNCNNEFNLFKKYIEYIKNKLFKNKIIYYNNYYYIKDYDSKNIELLFMNGIFPDKPSWKLDSPLYFNYNLNEFNNKLDELIKLKKTESYELNYYYKWCIVILVLKKFVKNKFNKFKDNYMDKIQLVNSELKFLPNLNNNSILYKSLKPQHITPLDLYNDIHKTHIFISQKADGLYKQGLFSIYPKLSSDINLDNLEYEFIKKDNICYVFNSLDNDYENMFIFLRSEHKYIPKINYPPLNLNNYETVLNNYKHNESLALNDYINQNKKIKKWWAKYIFKIEDMNKNDYITLLDNITKINLDFIPNDGWILINNKKILKIKPKHLLTIDLLYKQHRLLDSNNNTYNYTTNINLINNKIYRCYYDEQLKVWIPKDIRYDKFKPNNRKICKFIELSHLYQWNITDLKFNEIYYQKYQLYNKNYYYKKEQLIYQKFKSNETILDLGCGYRSIKNTNYVGIDIDPKILVNQSSQNNIYICDINTEWNLSSQIKIYNNIYYYLPNIYDFKIKYNNTKFNTILSINSIHYFINSKCDISIFFRNLNTYVQKGSQFIIRFLDKNLLDILLQSNYISNGSSFIRKMDTLDDSYKIKLYYEWAHINPIEEEVFSKDIITTIFENNGWALKEYNVNKLNTNLSNWDMYFKCFSTLVFIKK